MQPDIHQPASSPAPPAPAGSVGDDATEYVTFTLSGLAHAIDISAAREIRGWAPATVIPHAPPCITGLFNLRGSVIPILDLSERFGLGRCDPTPRHVIIVADIAGRQVGLLVDAVTGIVAVNDGALLEPPAFAESEGPALVRRLIDHAESGLVRVCDVDALLPEGVAQELNAA